MAAPRSAPLVSQWLAANGIILGKVRFGSASALACQNSMPLTDGGPQTNLGELQSGYATNPNNPDRGIYTALNPYDPTRSPQGSSSGSGVALAARLAPVALCEDTGKPGAQS